MKRTIAIVAIVMTLVTLGCTNMSRTQQSTLTGGMIGAGGGAALSAIAGGNSAIGAAVGGAVGLLGGYIVGESSE